MKWWIVVSGCVVALLGCVIFLTANGWIFPKNDNDIDADEPLGGFAADRLPKGKEIAFDGKRAMDYLKKICDIGPRMSGTPNMGLQQQLIRKHFEDLEADVEFQTFTFKQVSRKVPVTMSNLIVSFHAFRKKRAIICAHYDTRPIADQEPDPRDWRKKFVSANDGGSGVAFMMEFAHHIFEIPTEVGIDFVFFDGEEFIWDSKVDKYFAGSTHFAQTWRKKPLDKREQYVGAVLLDMIAGKNAKFPAEGNSWARQRHFVNQIWGIARHLKCDRFQQRIGEKVLDDHIALLNAGIPAIDIIDFDYPHWHRLTDTPENCSPDGMIQVSKVLTAWLQTLK